MTPTVWVVRDPRGKPCEMAPPRYEATFVDGESVDMGVLDALSRCGLPLPVWEAFCGLVATDHVRGVTASLYSHAGYTVAPMHLVSKEAVDRWERIDEGIRALEQSIASVDGLDLYDYVDARLQQRFVLAHGEDVHHDVHSIEAMLRAEALSRREVDAVLEHTRSALPDDERQAVLDAKIAAIRDEHNADAAAESVRYWDAVRETKAFIAENTNARAAADTASGRGDA